MSGFTFINKGLSGVDNTNSGSGTVTSVSVQEANGFTGSVANPTTTPIITIGATINGIVKGNGTALEEAEAGVDYLTPTSVIDGGTF